MTKYIPVSSIKMHVLVQVSVVNYMVLINARNVAIEVINWENDLWETINIGCQLSMHVSHVTKSTNWESMMNFSDELREVNIGHQ